MSLFVLGFLTCAVIDLAAAYLLRDQFRRVFTMLCEEEDNETQGIGGDVRVEGP